MSQQIYTIVITDEAFQGASQHTDRGEAVPLSLDSLRKVIPELDGAAAEKLVTLEATHSAALTAKDAELAQMTSARDAARAAFEEKAAANEALTARIAELTAVPETPDILTQLNAAFKSALPPEAQASFAMPYAIVRVLVQSGEIELARAVIHGIEVPPELAVAKAGLLDLLA